MAELTGDFLAERLTSKQLLALLFVCECRRKKTLAQMSFSGSSKPPAWMEFVDRFAARLTKLPESERTYLIGSHLQSAEELDIYSNETVEALLNEHRDIIAALVTELDRDGRFT